MNNSNGSVYHNPLNALALTILMDFPPFSTVGRGLHLLEGVPRVVEWIKKCRSAWVAHPQFEEMSQYQTGTDETWAEVLMVFRHGPGIEGRINSFVVCDIRELPFAYKWATRTRIGDFVGVYPLPMDFCANPHRLLLYANGTEGKGRGYHARMELKRLLPTKLRPLVNKHRSAKKTRKVSYLSEPLRCNNMRPFVTDASSTVDAEYRIPSASLGAITEWLKTGVELPEWYRTRSKADLWVERLATQDPKTCSEIAYWMGDVRKFYHAVIGDVHPNDIQGLFVRLPKSVASKDIFQLQLF